MAVESQLYLLADHIKLCLLERQRAQTLQVEAGSQQEDGHVLRSLDQMRDGLDALERDIKQAASGPNADAQDGLDRLRQQFTDLSTQFEQSSSASAQKKSSPLLVTPNDPSLASDFAHAQSPSSSRPQIRPASSFRRSPDPLSPNPSKSVRFSDTPQFQPHQEFSDNYSSNRSALFPYRDQPPDAQDSALDTSANLSNQQIHAYHADVLNQQDEQLDRLGQSIGRQRDLSIQIGNELDEHITMLDEVDHHVDVHQSRLNTAKRQLNNVSRRAKDNKQLTVIFVLVVILILLVIILKG